MLRLKKENLKIILSRHALIRAMQRGIHPELIEDTIKTGKFKKRKGITIIEKNFKEKIIKCVAKKENEYLKIITITCDKK